MPLVRNALPQILGVVTAITPVLLGLFAIGASPSVILGVAIAHLGLSLLVHLVGSAPFARLQSISIVDAIAVTSFVALVIVLYVSHHSVLYRLSLIVIGISALVLMLRGILAGQSSDHSSWGSKNDEGIVLSSALFVLSLKGFLPLLPTASSLMVWAYVSKRRAGTLTLRLGLFAILLFSAWYSRAWAEREPYWFWMTFDQQFRASLATGLTRWGYTDWNSAAGITLHYHWLGEAVSGLISRTTSQDEWLIVTRAAPLLFFLSAMTAIWRLLALWTAKPNIVLIASMIVAILLLEFDPYSIGILLGLSLALRSIEALSTSLMKSRTNFYLLSLVVLSLVAQAPIGLASGSIVICVCLYQYIIKSSQRFEHLNLIGAILGVFLILRETILREGSHSAASFSFKIQNFLQFGGYDVPFGLDPGSPGWLRMANSASFVMELLALTFLGLFGFRYDRWRLSFETKSYVEIACFSLAGPLLLMNVLDLGIAQGKLISITLSLLLTLSLVVAVNQLVLVERLLTKMLVALSALIIAMIYLMFRNLQPDSLAAVASVGLVAMSALTALGLGVGLARKRILWNSLLVTCVVPTIIIGLLAGRLSNARIYLERPPINESEYLASGEVITCLRWIRESTPSSSIIATNLFDPQLLPNSGKSHITSMLTKRRVWLDGLYMKRDTVGLIEERVYESGVPRFDVGQVDFIVSTPDLRLAESKEINGERVFGNSSCAVWDLSS